MARPKRKKVGLIDLPPEVRQVIAPFAAQDQDTLDAIAISLVKKKAEAVAARAASGIEQLWKECEEAYVGIDDANRHEFQDARWAKPMSTDGPVTTGRRPDQTDHKSTAYLRLTARYVDAGTAKLSEILLPIDDKAFSFAEMPVPELIKAKDDQTQVVHTGLANALLTRPATPEEAEAMGPQANQPVGQQSSGAAASPAMAAAAQAGVVPQSGAAPQPQPEAAGQGAPTAAPQPAQGQSQAPRVPLTVADLATERIELERAKAKAAEQRVYDWMVQSRYPVEARKVIFDAARLGVGVIKAPIPESKRKIAALNSGSAIEVVIEDKIIPTVKWADVWNIFPDPACGEAIQEGDYCWERDFLSEAKVLALKDQPGYIAAQIDLVLKEGPNKGNLDPDAGAGGRPDARKVKGNFEVWYFHGSIKRTELECICQAAGVANDADADLETVPVIVTLINDKVVKAAMAPLDSGTLPYMSFPWQRRADNWAGIGIAEQLRTPQRMLNAATRAMLNNAGKSAGSQIVIDLAAIRPMDGSWTITPDKIWAKKADQGGNDVREAFHLYPIENVTDQLMKIVNFAVEMAEQTTSIPLVSQGQSGNGSPETFGAAQLQDTNANQLLRTIGYAYDDFITEPMVRAFYEWLLLDPDVPDDEKGEFEVNAHGSAALVERAIMDQTIAQMGQLSANPVYGLDPKRWAKQFLKSKRLDPQDFQYTEDEQAKIEANPPTPYQVQVAEIQRDGLIKVAAMKQQGDQLSLQHESQIEQAAQVLEGKKVQNKQDEIRVGATVRLHQEQMRYQTELLRYANQRGIALDAAKADLAKETMRLQTQERLNAADNATDLAKTRHRNRGAHPQHSTPPLETPPGRPAPNRAGNGRAFEGGPTQ